MSKKLVSQQYIVDWINNRLQEEYDGDVSIKHITPLRELNSNGCNWSESVVTSSGGDSGVAIVIQEAQKLFNINRHVF